MANEIKVGGGFKVSSRYGSDGSLKELLKFRSQVINSSEWAITITCGFAFYFDFSANSLEFCAFFETLIFDNRNALRKM